MRGLYCAVRVRSSALCRFLYVENIKLYSQGNPIYTGRGVKEAISEPTKVTNPSGRRAAFTGYSFFEKWKKAYTGDLNFYFSLEL